MERGDRRKEKQREKEMEGLRGGRNGRTGEGGRRGTREGGEEVEGGKELIITQNFILTLRNARRLPTQTQGGHKRQRNTSIIT